MDKIVGICAFKGAPTDNKVEISYWVFPAFERKGIATAACKALIGIAITENREIIISARTLPEINASTRILEKNDFRLLGTVVDPDDGEVYKWHYEGHL
jgi:RimJ/RimL family protein N-acetyltransferase